MVGELAEWLAKPTPIRPISTVSFQPSQTPTWEVPLQLSRDKRERDDSTGSRIFAGLVVIPGFKGYVISDNG
jgi:hypothetical protein